MRRLAPVLALAGALLTPAPALACGGLFCQNQPVDQAGEKILFVTDGTTVTAHVQIQYQGPAKDFSWVVPVPTEPKLGVGNDRLFRRLEELTRPTFRLDLDDEGTCAPPRPGTYPVFPGPMASAPVPSGMPPVEVVSRGQVGPFDAAVIRSNDPGALKAWLRDNGYVLPPALDPLLDPYVAGKYFFIALKLRKDREAGDLQPIVFKYAATKPGIPIRLTGVAATPDMGVYVWLLGDERAVPENYRHAAINEARIDWLAGGQNYPQVVTEAMNEAGGQAFVTDFAGKLEDWWPGVLARKDFAPDALKGATEPRAFVMGVVEGGYFGWPGDLDGDGMLAFLRRWVPKPAALAELDDQTFYNSLARGGTFPELAEAQAFVDTRGAIADLRATVVEPLAELHAQLERHRYLTRMYTTMSPEEMTQDPMFVFNGALPAVANLRQAKGARLCAAGVPLYDAPIRITLANGLAYTVAPRPYLDSSPRPLAMPAAGRVEQLQATGGPALIADNARAIRLALAEAGALIGPVDPPGAATPAPSAPSAPPPAGAVAFDPATGQAVAAAPPAEGRFGCAGCANPAKGASAGGEGFAFALFALGLAGWRWRAGRSRPRRGD